VIVKNESIYKMQKSLFEFIWDHAEENWPDIISKISLFMFVITKKPIYFKYK
jgi:hypothetical protein